MKSKGNKLAAQLAILGGILGVLKNGFDQLEKSKYDPDSKFDFVDLLGSGLIGAAVGGAIGLGYSKLNNLFGQNELDKEDFEEVGYLEEVLVSYNPDEIDKKTIKKGVAIKNKFYNIYKTKILGKPKFQGSMAQGTALSGISDLDILIQFKKNSFRTLEEMYFTVLDFFKNEFSDYGLEEVRAQRKSIGLIYDISGEQVCIDIVPAKRTDFKKGGNNYHLYDNPSGWFGKPSRVKMNPYKQADFGSDEKAKANIIVLLKILKTSEDYPLKSVLIKELTKSAFGKKEEYISGKQVDQQLIVVMKYIRDNIEYKKVVSPDNSNNILSDCLTRNEKRKVANSLDYIIEDIEDDPSRLQKYFPLRGDL